MSIPRYAQDKFDYQDLLTLRFALDLIDFPDLEVRPEPHEGEDIEVRFSRAGVAQVFQVQAKDQAAAMDLGGLASHLAHPTPHRVDESLMDKLVADSSLQPIFATSARCADDVARFAAPAHWTGATSHTISVNLKTSKALLGAFAEVDLQSSRYEIDRKAHRALLAGQLDVRQARDIFSRIVILERLTADDLRQHCVRALSRRLRISEPMAADVLSPSLMTLVRRAKKTGSDLAPELRDHLAAWQASPYGDPTYEPRGGEANLASRLEAEHVLLLAGPPRCGKSQAANHIAHLLQGRGIELCPAADPDAARRLLYENAAAPRLVLLDDPLGDGWSVENAPGAYDTLRALLSKAGPRQMLLIAQNQTPLLAAAGASSLDAVHTAGRRWVDMTVTDGVFLAKVWHRKADQAGVPAAAIARLAAAFATDAAAIDLGALQDLAASGQIAADTTVAQMVALADQGAVAFGQRLANDSPLAGRILASFGLGTDPATGLDTATLAFVAEGPEATPSLMPDFIRVYSLTEEEEPPPPAPEYELSPELSQTTADQVERLENRRVLVAGPNGRLNLAHGYYRSAALGLLTAPAAASTARHLAILRRALFCLDPRVSRAAARGLERAYRALPDAARGRVIDLAAEGMGSLFPGTRDLCLRFLSSHLTDLPKTREDDVATWVEAAYSTDLDDIVWRDGEAWLSTSRTGGYSPRFLRRAPPRDDIADDLEALERDGGGVLSAERAQVLLLYFDEDPTRLTKPAVRRLLAFDEAVLRGEAGRLWLKIAREDDVEILDLAFAERHPRVARSLLDGLADGWSGCAQARRDDLLARFVAMAASPTVATPLLSRIVLMPRVEYFGETPPWPIFGAILPVLLDHVLGRVSGVEPRLHAATQDALRHLPTDTMVVLCRAWIGWLARTADRDLRTDYAWGVLPILFAATEQEPGLRAGMLDPLFALAKNTGAAAMLVGEMVDAWALLTPEERSVTTDLLRASRPDSAWLGAVALTRHDLHEDVQRIVLAGPLAPGPEQLLTQLPAELLEACLDVHLGVQPFWYLALHHAAENRWAPLADLLAARPTHPLGRRCMEDLVTHEHLPRLDAALPAWSDRLDVVFDAMLRHRLASSGWRRFRPVWEQLFRAAEPHQRAEWDARLAEVAPVLVKTPMAIRDDLGLDLDDAPQLIKRVQPDLKALQMTLRLKDFIENQEDLASPALDVFRAVVELERPILTGTYEVLRSILDVPSVAGHPLFEQLIGWKEAAWSQRNALSKEHRWRDREVDSSKWTGPF